MGYNTPLLILNDALGDIETHPAEFVQRIVSAIHAPDGDPHVPAGVHANAAYILPTMHASHPRVIVSQGNLLTELVERGPIVSRAEGDAFWRDEIIRRAERARDIATKTLVALGTTPEDLSRARTRPWT
jgi:hypothetical protein